MPLSDRETVVLSLVARGLTDREVARQLSVALSTARKHRENILDKLKVGRSSALVGIYLCLGAVPTWKAGSKGRQRRCRHASGRCLAVWPKA
ncbi:Bacterial regulatory protein, luxR family [compost metagenome]|nr:LuxR C-terminal-related transcriptional regulator [Pseudomonas alkylphenolica]